MIGIEDTNEIMRRTKIMTEFVDWVYKLDWVFERHPTMPKHEFTAKLGKFINDYMYGGDQ